MNIVTAESGKQCLELVKNELFHIIFMDHMMPEMDGVETFHEIQKMKGSPNEKTPVIALTANAISGAREYYLQEGFADYLTKPIDSAKLEQMIAAYLPEELVHMSEGEAEENKAKKSMIEENKAEESGKENAAAGESGTAKANDAADYSRYLEYGINIENGIFNVGGKMSLYMDIVEIFLEDKEKQDQLKQFMTDHNAKDYGVLVHALKGDARMLGADSLADVAYEHEKQSKAGNLAYVEEHWDELVENWERTRKGFEEFYRKSREEQEAPP